MPITRRIVLASALVICAIGLPVVLGVTGANSSEVRIDKIDQKVLLETSGGREASFVIHLSDQADVSSAHGLKNQTVRGRYVADTLKAHAARTQAPLRSMLASRNISYRSFWVANIIVATGDRALVEDVADRSDVKVIESNASSRWIEDEPAAGDSPDTVEWGVANVRAPEVWATGNTGQGIVIANQDTGMRWTHNALKPHYRGWNGSTADHNYNWHDSIHSGGGICGANTVAPCDDHSHGTHTTGTTSGDDGAGNQIGVAPGAKWIGCRNMNVGVGTPATYTECFQWFIAPTDLTGNNPDPSKRPHVMNNSWGCPPSEGCAADTLRTIVENTEAAGILVVASAGNSGPACSTVQDPPAIYAASFSVGAINSANALASFSSRGPVTIDGSGRMKPNISAPGRIEPLGDQRKRYGIRDLQRHLDGRPARGRRRGPALVGAPEPGQEHPCDEAASDEHRQSERHGPEQRDGLRRQQHDSEQPLRLRAS